MKALIVCLLVIIAGCATSPNAQRMQASQTIGYLSNQLDRLEKNGYISSDDEIEQQQHLLKANRMLRSDADIADYLECAGSKNLLECSGTILNQVEIYLREQQETH